MEAPLCTNNRKETTLQRLSCSPAGLEIPCTLIFEGCSKDITKVEELIKKSMTTPTQQEEASADMKRPSEHASEDEPSRKKACTWIDQDVNTEAICNGKKLTDYLSGSFHTLMIFSQQSCKQRRPLGTGNLYLTNFR